jgi:anti-anti-sigma factor
MNTQHIATRQLDDVTVVSVMEAELGAKTGDALNNEVERLRELSPPMLVLDLASVKFLCSVSLGMLVRVLRRVRESGGSMAIAGLDGQCRRVLEVTGLDRVLSLHRTVDEAAWSLRNASGAPTA